MNLRLRPLLATLAASLTAVAFSSCASAPLSAPPMTHRVTAVERHNGTIIEAGDTALTVRQMLGEPHRKLAHDVWVYDRFEASRDDDREDGCHTLVVIFAKERVAAMRLINPGAEPAIIASLQPKPPGQVVAANQ